MRRWAGLLSIVCAVALVTGCAGADARKAEALLLRAQQAQHRVVSESFVLKLGIDAPGVSGEIDMQGGAYVRGARSGDFYMTMSGQGFPEAGALNYAVVRRGSTVAVHGGGQTLSMPVPAAQAKLGQGFGDMAQMLDFANDVKSVSVDSADFAGRPADRIVGTIDLQRLLGSFGGAGAAALGTAGLNLGDARVVLFVPRDTHLVEVMLADMTIKAHGESARFHLSIALSGINKPLTFPLL
jgi:hypothetical protein